MQIEAYIETVGPACSGKPRDCGPGASTCLMLFVFVVTPRLLDALSDWDKKSACRGICSSTRSLMRIAICARGSVTLLIDWLQVHA